MHTIISAQRKDKEVAVEILYHSFKNDPHINWMVGEGKNKPKRMRRLMSYAFEYGLVNGLVQLAEDRKAVAIWKKPRSHKMSFRLLLENVRFLLDFGFKRTVRITQKAWAMVRHCYGPN